MRVLLKGRESDKRTYYSRCAFRYICGCDFTIRGENYFKADPIIKDVCVKCNNEILSELDGTNLIKKYFVSEYDPDTKLNIDYDYRLLSRWLLKIGRKIV